MTKLLQFPPAMMHMLWWVILAAVVDAAVGVVFSVVSGTFDMERVGKWLVTNVLLVVVPVIVVAILVGAGMFANTIFYAAAATAIATLVGGIAAKIGVPLTFNQGSQTSAGSESDTAAK